TRVLVADSDPGLVSVVMRGLSQVGLEAIGCTSSPPLARHLERQSFDLVVLGYGLAALDELSLGNARKVVLVSFLGDLAERELRRHCFVLHKPFTSIELLGVLREELGLLRERPDSLVGTLSTAHRLRESISVCVSSDAGPCRIEVAEGEIVHAEVAALQG